MSGAKTRTLGRVTIWTDVDVDLDEVIGEVSSEDLYKVLEQRGVLVRQKDPGEWDRFADDVRAAARAGDLSHLDVLLARQAPQDHWTRKSMPDRAPTHQGGRA